MIDNTSQLSSCTAWCRECGHRIDGDIHYDAAAFGFHPDCLQGEPVAASTQRDLQWISLRLASPMRAIDAQQGAVDLPLFGAAAQGNLL
jgi:hypothetical protein